MRLHLKATTATTCYDAVNRNLALRDGNFLVSGAADAIPASPTKHDRLLLCQTQILCQQTNAIGNIHERLVAICPGRDRSGVFG